MTIDPEVIPPSSSAGKTAVRFIPKWAIYGAIGLVVLIIVGALKAFLPLPSLYLRQLAKEESFH